MKVIEKFINLLYKNSFILLIIITILTISTQTLFIRGYYDVEIRIVILSLYSLIIFARLYLFKFSFTFSEILWSAFTVLAVIGALLNSKSLSLDIIQPIAWWFVVIGIVSLIRIARPDDEYLTKWLMAIVFIELILALISLIDFLDIYKLSHLVSNNVQPNGQQNVSYFGCFIGSYTFGQEMLLGLLATISIFGLQILYQRKHGFKEYVVYFLSFIVFLPLIIYSNDRDSILAFCLSAFILFALLYKNKYITIKLHYIIIFVLINVFIFWIFYFIGLLQPLINKVLKSGTSHRIDIWLDVIKTQKDHILSSSFFFGDGFRHASSKYIIMKKFDLDNFHSIIFDIWARYGFLNLILVLGYLLTGIKKALNNKSKLRYLTITVLMGLIVFEITSGELVTATFRMVPFFIVFFLALVLDMNNNDVIKNTFHLDE